MLTLSRVYSVPPHCPAKTTRDLPFVNLASSGPHVGMEVDPPMRVAEPAGCPPSKAFWTRTGF